MGKYRCGKCGFKGHNARTCRGYEAEKAAKQAQATVGLPPEPPFMPAAVSPRRDAILAQAAEQVGREGDAVPAATGRKLDCWDLADQIIPRSRLTLLYGPPGTGKTTAGNFAGNPEKVYNVTVTEDMPSAELRGHYIPVGDRFEFRLGPALLAFTEGARLVANEIDKACGDTLSFFHALLDDPGISRFTLPTGETLEPHPGFTVVATMNGTPHDLPAALRDRFSTTINIDKLHPKAIASLPKDLRKPAAKGISDDADRSMSMRGWKAFATLREQVGPDIAAQAIFGARAETILNTIRIGAAKLDTYSADNSEAKRMQMTDIPF